MLPTRFFILKSPADSNTFLLSHSLPMHYKGIERSTSRQEWTTMPLNLLILSRYNLFQSFIYPSSHLPFSMKRKLKKSQRVRTVTQVLYQHPAQIFHYPKVWKTNTQKSQMTQQQQKRVKISPQAKISSFCRKRKISFSIKNHLSQIKSIKRY